MDEETSMAQSDQAAGVPEEQSQVN